VRAPIAYVAAAFAEVSATNSRHYRSKPESTGGLGTYFEESFTVWPVVKLPKETPMKKSMVVLLAVTFAMSLTAFAQQDTMAPNSMKGDSAKAPLMTLKGTVKMEGDKTMFVNDKDGKSWDVMNPEELKGHEGHHVQLSAHVYKDKNSIHVMSVKMMKGGDNMSGSMSH
jgi:hypothetical protein